MKLFFGLTARSITDKLAVWSRKAGVKLHPHSLRHSFAEQLLEKGTPFTTQSPLNLSGPFVARWAHWRNARCQVLALSVPTHGIRLVRAPATAIH